MTAKKYKRPSLQYPTTPVFDFLRKTRGRIPGKVAIIDPAGGRELTFSQIDQESDILAEIFLRWGMKKGDRISFFMPNGWEYFVGFYAAMKVGAVVSPMNPTYREREVKLQVNDAESRILIVQSHLYAGVEGILPELPTLEKIIITRGDGMGTGKVFALTDLLEKPPGQSSLTLPLIDAKEDLAALPYSSGTAGLNKGVMISHFNLVCNTLQSRHAAEAREDDVFISFLPFNHIY